MRFARIIALAFAATLFFSVPSTAKHVKSTLLSRQPWAYVSKFCFAEGEGTLNWKVIATPNNLTMVLYNDDAWNKVHKNKDLTCEQKISEEYATIIKYNGIGEGSGLIHIENSDRPHFWYVVFADCHNKQRNRDTLRVEYILDFTNPGGKWSAQFSYDEQGLFFLYLVFLLFYVALIIAHIYAVIQFRSVDSYHAIIKMLSLAIIASFGSVFFNLIHYGVYSSNGLGTPGLKGLVLGFTMDLVLTSLVILVATGWSITTPSLTPRSRTAMMVLVGCLLMSYIALFFWDFASPDPYSNRYFWESIPGYLILSLRAVCFALFAYCLLQTLRTELQPEKRRFYRIFGACYGYWLLSIVLIVILAASLSSAAPWAMLRVVVTLKVLTDFISVVGLSALMWPKWARQYFIITTGATLLGDYSHTPVSQGDDQNL